MTATPDVTAERSGVRPRFKRPVQVLCILAFLILGVVTYNSQSDALVAGLCNPTANGGDACPVSCPFSATITGADPGQAGAIRCYLRALADRSTKEMRKAIPDPEWGGPITKSEKAFSYSTDAQSGQPHVIVRPNQVDSASAIATIQFADGKRIVRYLQIEDPMTFDSWRVWEFAY